MKETLLSCPVCSHKHLRAFGEATDFTVSNEKFSLTECVNCGFVFTNPRPNSESIGPYYESEEYVSHTSTKKGLIFSLYHAVRSFTLGRKARFVSRFMSGTNLLDVGCGTGDFLSEMQKRGWNVKGIEPAETARLLAKRKGLDVYPQDFLFHGFNNQSFDAITLWHVLEHVHDLEHTIRTLYKLLKPDGILLIAVPNRDSLDAKHYGFHWAAWDVPRHLYHFRAKDVIKLMVDQGFKWEKTAVMPFDSFYVSLLSEKYIHGRYRYFQAFLVGLRSLISAWTGKDLGSSQQYVFRKPRA